MRRQRTMNPDRRGGLLALAAALVLAGGGLGAVVNPAQAAFPGRNGKIAFTSNRITAGNPTGDDEIFTMNPDGSGGKQLTDNAAEDRDPAWLADGTRIAVATNREPFARIDPPPGNPTGDAADPWGTARG